MLSKKYILTAGLLTLLSSTGLVSAQENSGMFRSGGYDFSDSSLIPKKRMPQQRDFLNNQYDFPAKPRNQWEVGVSFGGMFVSGDIRSKNIVTAQSEDKLKTLGWGLHVRKAWGYVISTRLQYIHGSAVNFNYEGSKGYYGHFNNQWYKAGYWNLTSQNQTRNVYYNSRTQVRDLSLQLIANLNNLRFHRARNRMSLYTLAGIGGLAYRTTTDLRDASNNLYDFKNIDQIATITNNYKNRKEINSALKDKFDGNYETLAERHGNRLWLFDEYTFRPTATVGLGMQFRLGKRFSIGIEDRWLYTNDDLIDGQRWQEKPYVESSIPGTAHVASAMTRDYDNINYLSLSFNVHLGGNAVAPLWWMNPLDYGYNEIKRPRAGGDGKCDKDSDGDGISDCFDRCPNTPGGVTVDSHGCPFDTDGDGVADYKDKQLITPTECQPVDADGVGKCPDPECCKGGGVPSGCSAISGGTITFPAGSSKLTSAGMSQLNSLAASMRANPNCKVVVIGNGSGSKVEQQRSWDRVNSVINYMVDKQGIDRDRFIFQYGSSMGDANSVNYRVANAGEEGPSNTPPPFPNLRK